MGKKFGTLQNFPDSSACLCVYIYAQCIAYKPEGEKPVLYLLGGIYTYII